MSNGNSSQLESRMDRAEAALVSAGDLLMQTSEITQRNARLIERNSQLIDRNAQQLEQQSIRSDQLLSSQAITFRNLAQITEMTIEFRADMRSLTQKMEALTVRVDSLTAASERHDAILDYLINRDQREED